MLRPDSPSDSPCPRLFSRRRCTLLIPSMPTPIHPQITTGYIYGNPRNWPFDHWINQSPNVIIVSVYYRLSSFGFLATPAFRDATNGDFNAGFLDQVQALKWVKENIGSFGGDPGMVTIDGESAGGSSVELHLVANEGERLFSQAIAQSVYRTPLPTPEQQKVSHIFVYLSKGFNCFWTAPVRFLRGPCWMWSGVCRCSARVSAESQYQRISQSSRCWRQFCIVSPVSWSTLSSYVLDFY
jgi:hypothetical protein